jgi:hypothetical protein
MEDQMLYMFLLYHDPAVPPPDDIMEQHFAVYEAAHQKGAYVCSEAIGGTNGATTVRVKNGKPVITDGPFIESKEVLGGFYILDCEDLDDALEYAAKIPDAQCGVEIRPVMDVPDWQYVHQAERKPFP